MKLPNNILCLFFFKTKYSPLHLSSYFDCVISTTAHTYIQLIPTFKDKEIQKLDFQILLERYRLSETATYEVVEKGDQ